MPASQGFASGPKVILDAIVTVNSGSILQASSLSQGVASRLISHCQLPHNLECGSSADSVLLQGASKAFSIMGSTLLISTLPVGTELRLSLGSTSVVWRSGSPPLPECSSGSTYLQVG